MRLPCNIPDCSIFLYFWGIFLINTLNMKRFLHLLSQLRYFENVFVANFAFEQLK
jgi:hypothetical protein